MTNGLQARAYLRLVGFIFYGYCLCMLATASQASPSPAPAADAGAKNEVSSDRLTADKTVSMLSESSASSGEISSGSLSVAPAGELRYPEDRPLWIDAGPVLTGKVHRWPVSSSPSSTVDLSHRSLEVQLRAAAETYIETLLDSPEAPAVVELRDDWIQARLVPDRRYSGEIYVGDEVLYEAAAELWFDSESRAEIASRWTSHQVRQRMIGLGAMTVGGTMLLLIATAGLSIIARRAERVRGTRGLVGAADDSSAADRRAGL